MRRAGLDPEVIVSGVDEADFEASSTAALTTRLARAKAEAVAALPEAAGALVLGCDSLLELDGEAFGKPGDAAAAVATWRRLRGRNALLHTGHHLIDTVVPRPERTAPPGNERRAVSGEEATVIRFGEPSDAEIDAYVGSGEPLAVAGAFTIDGRGGAFVAGIEGHPSNVIGLSIPLLRAMLGQLDISYTDLWI